MDPSPRVGARRPRGAQVRRRRSRRPSRRTVSSASRRTEKTTGRGRLDPWSLRLAMEATVKAGLESGDSQAACFACGMLRRVAREGDEPTRRFARRSPRDGGAASASGLFFGSLRGSVRVGRGGGGRGGSRRLRGREDKAAATEGRRRREGVCAAGVGGVRAGSTHDERAVPVGAQG